MVEETILNYDNTFPEILKREAEKTLGTALELSDGLKSADSYSYKLISKADSYVGKIYRFKDWPPKGKTTLLHQLLDTHDVAHEQIIYEESRHRIFKFGWQISKFIAGGTVREQRTTGTFTDQEYFPKIGAILRRVHEIKLDHYGSLTEKSRQFSTFEDYTKKKLQNLQFDKLPNEFSWAKDIINKALTVVQKDLIGKNFPDSCLLHDDVNEGNVMWNNGDPILIDWTDSLAGPVVRDFATMTFRSDVPILRLIEQGYGEKLDQEELRLHQILRFIRLGRFYFLENRNLEELSKMMARLAKLLERIKPYGI